MDKLQSEGCEDIGDDKSRAGHKEYSWEAKDSDTEGCNQEET